MPLKKGKAHEVIAGNIKELVGAGHDPKQAVAIALSHSRKYAEGGMVDDDDEMNRDIYEINADGADYPEKISNPEEESEAVSFAKMLRKQAMQDADGYAEGGVVEKDRETGSEEPMSVEPKKPEAMLDEAAMQALADRKKKRRYSM